MAATDIPGLIRAYFTAYENKNRTAVEDLLGDPFAFSSPHDPLIGRDDYFRKCWPNSANTAAFRIAKLFEQGNEAFVLYECETKSGHRFSNTEFFRFAGDTIREIRVFYGSLPDWVQVPRRRDLKCATEAGLPCAVVVTVPSAVSPR